MKAAGMASLGTALLCYPRFALWNSPYPIWYLLLVVLLGGFVLWAFVFAWHTPFTGQPVFQVPIRLGLFLGATVAGVAIAAGLHFFLDPTFRIRTPADYPKSVHQWIGMTLFALGFHPLFLTFAPLDWALRLFRSLRVAAGFTVLFGVGVMILKTQSASTPLPPVVLIELLVLRVVLASLAVYFYLRGGVLLVGWWTLLLQLRHLLTL